MAEPDDRRRPERPRTRRGGHRATDAYWTVPEIAEDLRMSERSVWRKYLEPPAGERLLGYLDLAGIIRVPDEEYRRFKAAHFRPLPPDSS